MIKVLRLEKGYGAKKLKTEFPARKWSLTALKRLVKQVDETGSAERRKGVTGRPRTARTADNVAAVDDMILSQEDKPRTHRTIRQITQETGITKSSVHRIAHQDLSLKCFKKKRAQDLTRANNLTRLVRAKQLLKKYQQHMVGFIWFSDEKLFTVQSPVNLQNDRLYAPATTKKKQLPADRLLRTRSRFSKSVMVSVAVSSLGCTELVSIEPGIKITGHTTAMNFSHSTCFQRSELFPETSSSSFNRTTLPHTEQKIRSSSSQEKRQSSSHRSCGLPTVLIYIQ